VKLTGHQQPDQSLGIPAIGLHAIRRPARDQAPARTRRTRSPPPQGVARARIPSARPHTSRAPAPPARPRTLSPPRSIPATLHTQLKRERARRDDRWGAALQLDRRQTFRAPCETSVCRPGRTLVGVVAQTVAVTVGAAHALCLRGVEVALADHPGGLVAAELQRGGGGQSFISRADRDRSENTTISFLQRFASVSVQTRNKKGGSSAATAIDGEARRRCSFAKRASPLAPGSRPLRDEHRAPPPTAGRLPLRQGDARPRAPRSEMINLVLSERPRPELGDVRLTGARRRWCAA
jgi:hypothetical protein